MRRQSCAVVALLAMVGGCVAYQPQPLEPQAELDRLRQHAPADARPATAPAGWDLDNGLNDSEVVAVALTLNPDLRARRIQIQQSQALLLEAGLWPNPELSVGWRAALGSAAGSALEGELLAAVLRPGQRSARRDLAGAQLEQTRAQILADEYRLVAEVRSQRLAVLFGRLGVELLSSETDLRRRALEVVNRQRAAGEASELAVSAAQLELAEAQRQLRLAHSDLQTQQRSLNRLLGLPPHYPLQLKETEAPDVPGAMPPWTLHELEQAMLRNRPELKAKHAEYQQAQAELRLAVLEQYPGLKLGPSFERELEGDKSLGLGVSLELPVFNRNQGQIALRQAQRDRVRAEYVALLHQLRADVADALANVQRFHADLDSQQRDVQPLVERNRRLFEGAFAARQISIHDWISASQRVVQARRQILAAQLAYAQSVVQLEVALGQGAVRHTTMPAMAPTTPYKKEQP
jgi:outer membrane protein TolC